MSLRVLRAAVAGRLGFARASCSAAWQGPIALENLITQGRRQTRSGTLVGLTESGGPNGSIASSCRGLQTGADDWVGSGKDSLPPISPIALRGLHEYVTTPTRENLTAASQFLSRELPLRLRHQDASLLAVLQGTDSAVSRILAPTLKLHQEVAHSLESLQDPNAGSMASEGSEEAGLTSALAFSDELAAFGETMEHDLLRAHHGMAEIVQEGGQHLAEVDACMDTLHYHLAIWRLLVSEHLKAVEKLRGAPKDMVQRRLWEGRVRSAVVNRSVVVDLLKNTVEDCRAFCIEKNSTSPEVVVQGDSTIKACLFETHFEFVITEVLKNAMQPLLEKYGAWDVDEAPPIQITVTRSTDKRGFFDVAVADQGGGIPEEARGKLFRWFSTSAQESAGEGYGYSRNHGAQFKGIGVGVNVTRVYCSAMGGSVRWDSDGTGTTATVTLPMRGLRI